ncbi:hypothetical protein E1B28_009603 [Marasmius oreades]|uniref:Uncharacterized protein n=1 Tax=Marasmius oreades TaxID=181124 RepID=A0A9P7RW56_9AGAR|nr:uncharacterized protein E1B28_009603 [Marasmius oreades]KAG7090490.1 hypothetical protein E1B28_009603 [Marasmius oreades]
MAERDEISSLDRSTSFRELAFVRFSYYTLDDYLESIGDRAAKIRQIEKETRPVHAISISNPDPDSGPMFGLMYSPSGPSGERQA